MKRIKEAKMTKHTDQHIKQKRRTDKIVRSLNATLTERQVDALLDQLNDQMLIQRLSASANWRA